MSTKPKARLGALLVESMRQAVAINQGRLRPARRHRLTLREATVSAPPRYGSSRIRRLRERLGLSQPVFARALNVSVATVCGWEQGARIPDGPSRRLLEVAERHPATILTAVSRVRPRSGSKAAA
ncbi:MAG: helix-turn-helix domain-containing protein [Planctomycetota bacterium]